MTLQEAGDGSVGLVLAATSFYAEQGGQVSDIGSISTAGGARLVVEDTKLAAGYVLHVGHVEGEMKVGDDVTTRCGDASW